MMYSYEDIQQLYTANNSVSMDTNITFNFTEGNVTVGYGITKTSSSNCREQINYWKFIIIYILTAFGIIGNTFSYIILHLHYKVSTTNFYLKALAVADTLVLISALFGRIFSIYFEDNTILEEVLEIAVKFILSDVSQFVSVWLIVILACSRFIAVVKPFKVGQYFTYRTAWVSTLVLIIISVVIESVRIPLVLTCKDKTPVGSNGTKRYNCYHDYYNQRNIYIETAYFGGGMFLFPLIPLLIFCVGLTVAMMYIRRNRHPNIPSPRRESSNIINKTIMAIIVTFIITYVWYFIWSLSYLNTDMYNYFYYHPCAGYLLDSLVYIGFHINSSVNCVIYLLCKKSFYSKSHLFFYNLRNNFRSTSTNSRHIYKTSLTQTTTGTTLKSSNICRTPSPNICRENLFLVVEDISRWSSSNNPSPVLAKQHKASLYIENPFEAVGSNSSITVANNQMCPLQTKDESGWERSVWNTDRPWTQFDDVTVFAPLALSEDDQDLDM